MSPRSKNWRPRPYGGRPNISGRRGTWRCTATRRRRPRPPSTSCMSFSTSPTGRAARTCAKGGGTPGQDIRRVAGSQGGACRRARGHRSPGDVGGAGGRAGPSGGRQEGGRKRAGSAPGTARRNQGRERRRPRDPRLERGQDPRTDHRPRLAAGRLAVGPAPGPGVRSHGHAERKGRRLCGLCPLGRRRQAAGGDRSEKDDNRPGGGAAAGEALRRLPGDHARPAAGHLLHQRLRDVSVG